MATETKKWIGIAIVLLTVYWLFLRPVNEPSVPDSLPMLTEASFDSEIADGDIVVDFYADWCGPCRYQKKILVGLSETNPSFKIAKVNVDDSPGLAQKFSVTSIPG
ncbi:MAG: thioredoxin family protein [Pirellulales bacterium]